jgi:hypothetical protein
MFQSRWHFTCACRFCRRTKEEIEASDDRREKMEDAIMFLNLTNAAHTTPKDPRQSESSHAAHLKTCDKQALVGQSGWQALDQLAKREGVDDINLYNR